ncbi:hypothetical protein [Flavobacterium sp.]|jgi:hypothetical protein|uniref:hypothetical protein n=1 Tax=Flavobacterium sp. TaxID=239 RepID=UPI0037C086FF
MANPQLYSNYRLINNLLSKSIRQEFGSHITINLNPLKYFLNRTHYSYWVEGVEQVSLDIRQPVSLKELNHIENRLLSVLNMIFKCVELENFKEVKKVNVLIT